jgi:integrase
VRDGLVKGLVLRITAVGAKSWALRYRVVGGQQRTWTIGAYPDLSLADARERAREARKNLPRIVAGHVIDGIDPAAVKQQARTEATVGALAKAYLADVKQPERKKSWRQDERILNDIVLPAWKHRPVTSIKRRDVKALLATVSLGQHRAGSARRPARPAPVMANRTLALISTMLNFALDDEWIEFNPAARLSKHKEKSRDRVLTDEEIRELWAACEATKTAAAPLIDPMIAIGYQLALLTAQRPGEVGTMQTADLALETVRPAWDGEAAVEQGWWTIPDTITKNGVAHRVWLVPRAVALVREAEALMAAAAADAQRRQVPWPANPYVLGSRPREGGGGKLGGSVANRSEKGIRVLRAKGAITRHATLSDYTRHDLRRTATTNMRQAGIPREHTSYVLNHLRDAKTPESTKTYDRYTFDAEKRTALDAWDRRLTAIVNATDTAATVVPFARASTETR